MNVKKLHRQSSSRPTQARTEVRGQDYASNVRLESVRVSNPTSRATALRRWTFRFDAPEAEQVCVAGTFNHWDPSSQPLVRHPNGCWFAELDLPRGQHEYRFVVDGVWHDDPNASQFVSNRCGGVNAVVTLR